MTKRRLGYMADNALITDRATLEALAPVRQLQFGITSLSALAIPAQGWTVQT